MLALQSDRVKAAVDNAALNAARAEIDRIGAVIAAINAKISALNPGAVTLKDEAEISDIAALYASLSEADRQFVEYYEDVTLSEKIIAGLKKFTMISKLLAYNWGSEEVYTASGEGYTVSVKGTDIENPDEDFSFALSFGGADDEKIKALAGDSFIFTLAHEGKMPVKAVYAVKASLADGEYRLYRFENGKPVYAGKAVVKSSEAVFEAVAGGEYFITASNLGGDVDAGDSLAVLSRHAARRRLFFLRKRKRIKISDFAHLKTQLTS